MHRHHSRAGPKTNEQARRRTRRLLDIGVLAFAKNGMSRSCKQHKIIAIIIAVGPMITNSSFLPEASPGKSYSCPHVPEGSVTLRRHRSRQKRHVHGRRNKQREKSGCTMTQLIFRQFGSSLAIMDKKIIHRLHTHRGAVTPMIKGGMFFSRLLNGRWYFGGTVGNPGGRRSRKCRE